VLQGLFAPTHILVILIVALLVLGPKELPRAARQLARVVGDVRRFADALRDEARTALGDLEESASDDATDAAADDDPSGRGS
jgi:Tat protein translocase TatB subunit